MRETSRKANLFPNCLTSVKRELLCRSTMLFSGWHYKANVKKEKRQKCEQRMLEPNYCKWRLAVRSEEGDRPLHSDKTPSLNIKFFAGSGTPVSAQDWESTLEKLASVGTSRVEAPSWNEWTKLRTCRESFLLECKRFWRLKNRGKKFKTIRRTNISQEFNFSNLSAFIYM